MNETVSIIALLEPTPIYNYGAALAQTIYTFITPILLLIAIFIRTMETQLDVVAGQGGKWGPAIRDFLGWATVLTIYFALANLIGSFMNSVYAWIDGIGSMASVGKQLSALTTQLQERLLAQQENDGTINTLIDNIFTLPTAIVSLLFYYFSLIFVTTIHVFLKIAHAIGYSVAIAYGLIAIPLSITRSMRLLRGWATFMGFLLLWPLVLGFALALFSPLFTHAAETMVQDPELSVSTATQNMYMFFTILNILIIGILIAAPFVAGSLAANAPAHSGMVMPFVAAGAAAAAAAFKGDVKLPSWGRGDKDDKEQPGGSSARANAVPQPQQLSATGGAASAGAAADAGSEPEPQASTPADDGGQSRARQQRRGAIINQTRKVKGE